MDDVPVQNPDQVDAVLAISQTIIIPCHDRSVKDSLAAGKIEPMMLEIFEFSEPSFWFVICNLAFKSKVDDNHY